MLLLSYVVFKRIWITAWFQLGHSVYTQYTYYIKQVVYVILRW